MHAKLDHHTSTFYIVGNGPSLRPYELELLPDEQWLGMNSAFKYWQKINKYPKYYACLDPVVVESQKEGILELIDKELIKGFFLHDAILEHAPQLKDHPRVTFLNAFVKSDLQLQMGDLAQFKKTTGALATRYAIEKGHTNLCLLGIDCNYVEIIDEAKELEGLELEISDSVKKNPNYFFADYQSAGDKYQIPNPPRHDGNLHLQSFVALKNDLQQQEKDVSITIASPKSLLYQYSIFPHENLNESLHTRRLSCVAVPMIRSEVDSFLESLKLWNDPRLQPSLTQRHKGTILHLFFDCAEEKSISSKLNKALSDLPNIPHYFKDFKITFLNLPKEINYYYKLGEAGDGDFCRKSGPNIQFLSLIRQCQNYEYTFLMETDCVPIRPGWLDALENNLGKGSALDAWIMGSRYQGPSDVSKAYRFHTNGNALYNTGNPDFQEFVAGCFLDTLKDLINQEYDHLAYDTIISCLLDGEFKSSVCPRLIDTIIPRYRYTNVIKNVGGDKESKDRQLIDYNQIIQNEKDCYLLHGRSAKDYIQNRLPSLDLFYPYTAELTREILSFDTITSKNKKLAWKYNSKGNFSLSNLDPDVENLLFFTRIARRDNCQITVKLSTETNTQISNIQLFGQTNSFKVEPITTQMSSMGQQYLFKGKLEQDAKQYRRFGIKFQLKTPKASTQLSNVYCFEEIGQQAQAIPQFNTQEPTQATLSLIENWQHYINEKKKHNALAVKISRLSIEETHFLDNKLFIDFEHSEPIKDNEMFFQAVSKANVLKPDYSPFITISTLAPEGHHIQLRLCRHGETTWEYQDITLQGTQQKVIKNPFHEKHKAYRIEIHEFSYKQNASFSLIIKGHEAQETADSKPLNQAAIISPQFRRDFLKTILANDEASIRKQLLTIGKYQNHLQSLNAVIDTLKRRSYYPELITLTKVMKQLSINTLAFTPPNIAYIDPIRIGMISATQELRKKLLENYHTDLTYIISPVINKQANKWHLHRPSGNKKELKTNEITHELNNLNIDLIIYRAGYVNEDAPLLHKQLTEIAPKVIVYMMDKWDERLELTNETTTSIETLKSFKTLIKHCQSLISISHGMAEYMHHRYQKESAAIVHNYAKFTENPLPKTDPQATITIFYGGGLEKDMTYDSLNTIAKEVKQISTISKIHLIIKTFERHKGLLKSIEENVGKSDAISYISQDLSLEEYENVLADVDIFLLTYNFDETSASYISSSFPNKFSDYLGFLKPIIYYGPNFAIAQEISRLNILGIRWCKSIEALKKELQNINSNYQNYQESLVTSKKLIEKTYGRKSMLKKLFGTIMKEKTNKEKKYITLNS